MASVAAGRRIVAGLIDMVPLIFLAVAMGDRSTDSGQFNVNLEGLKVLWWLLASIAYFAIAELATNTSPGKALMGLCVRDSLANTPTKRQIVIRSAMRIIDSLPVMYLVGLIASSASSRRQRLGDMAAGTVILHRSEVGEQNPGPTALASLAVVVLVTVGAGVALLATADTSEKLGQFDFEEEVVPYAEQIIEDALRPPSVDALQRHLARGIVSESDLNTFVDALTETAGGMTDEYEVDDYHFDEYEISPGTQVEAVSLRILGDFEKRPGELILTIAEVDGELRLIGFNFQV